MTKTTFMHYAFGAVFLIHYLLTGATVDDQARKLRAIEGRMNQIEVRPPQYGDVVCLETPEGQSDGIMFACGKDGTLRAIDLVNYGWELTD